MPCASCASGALCHSVNSDSPPHFSSIWPQHSSHTALTVQQHHIHCSSTGSDCQSLSLALRSASQQGALPNCCLHTAPKQLSGSYAVHMQHTPYPHSFHANLNTPPTRSCMQPLHSPHVAAADTRSDTLLASSRGGIGGGWGAGDGPASMPHWQLQQKQRVARRRQWPPPPPCRL